MSFVVRRTIEDAGANSCFAADMHYPLGLYCKRIVIKANNKDSSVGMDRLSHLCYTTIQPFRFDPTA